MTMAIDTLRTTTCHLENDVHFLDSIHLQIPQLFKPIKTCVTCDSKINLFLIAPSLFSNVYLQQKTCVSGIADIIIGWQDKQTTQSMFIQSTLIVINLKDQFIIATEKSIIKYHWMTFYMCFTKMKYFVFTEKSFICDKRLPKRNSWFNFFSQFEVSLLGPGSYWYNT
jgi:hypothetical protein